MRIYKGTILHSPSDLVRYLGCSHATTLDLLERTQPDAAPTRSDGDDIGALVQEAGLAHEEAYRAKLEKVGDLVEISEKGSLETRAQLTREAMKSGAQSIFQAAFLQAPWSGFADFLIRVEEPSELGGWSYEPVDTKLARSAKASHIVQLGLYAQMIAAIQGRMPGRMHVELGDGRRETFRLVDFAHVLRAASDRYLAFIGDGAKGTAPEPCAACALCHWQNHCTAVWEKEDRLTRIVGLSKPQAERLKAAGIATASELGAVPGDFRVKGMASDTFAKLRSQAVLQLARWRGGGPLTEPHPLEDARGFANLPAPDPADLFFDLEGDPLEEGGLDYLWGVHYRDGGKPDFRFRWGHDHAAERVAFEDTLDWIADHLEQHPGAHVYHYAPYEITSLRRLSTLHASREDKLDHLLRTRRFVDLFGVLRQAIRTSEPNLSLKTMEVFFTDGRSDNVTSAAQSIVEYKSWQANRDQSILDGILQYNKVDCENTEALRDWLLELRAEYAGNLAWRAIGPVKEQEAEKTEEAMAAQAAAEALIAAVHAGPLPQSETARQLVGHLTQFHRRADKPGWWSMFDRADRDPEELVEDGDCIGMIAPAPDEDGEWQHKVKRSIEASYHFDPQETKLSEGSSVFHAPTLWKMGTISHLDTRAGIVRVKRTLKGDDAFPEAGSLVPDPSLNKGVLVSAIQRVAESWADGQPSYQALLDLIDREPPRLKGWAGGPLRQEGESLIDAATARCLAMDETTLFIQGPPGTGKTYTSARVICALIAAGKRVGISSNSHKAIGNLMVAVEKAAVELGMDIAGVKKSSRGNTDSEIDSDMFDNLDRTGDIVDALNEGTYSLVGGTAWLFADEGMDTMLDYLFVDEAGQVAMANLLAMGSAARNIVLVGDQMQLAQPIQGAHPGESGLSALDYLLQGDATVAPESGILLDTSWRMHPSICSFISDAVYDGRLQAHPDCVRQKLHLASEGERDPVLAEHGLRFVAMDHTACGQRSDAEVTRVKELAAGLLGTKFTNRDGEEGTIRWGNILIVAPYNMQVNALTDALPSAARVGTVDKFQGQEAEVVIVSLTTSTPDDLPRHVEFFYSKNRINVAISRARTLALVLANPKLLELDAKSVEHLQLVNTLAWVAEEGSK